jgi:16S rRNA (guanine527-N7)-methyltransferase
MASVPLDNPLDQGLAALRLDPSPSVRARLLDYIALLARWNTTYNLTAVRDPADMVARHLLDSLAIAPYVTGDSLLDVGTGPGLPGIPLALLAPERRVDLLDTNGKKARFLREAVRQLKLPHVRVLKQRVEDAEGSYDCITARAFATLADMLRLGGHLLAPHGRWLAMKGRRPDEEIAALPAGFRVEAVHPLKVPGVEGERHLVVIARDGD